MPEQRWRADIIRATAEALIQVAEAEVRADGGPTISLNIRDVLTRALTRELSVPFRETPVTAAEHIEMIKVQMRLLADGVIAITHSPRRPTEDTWNAATARMRTAWMAGRDADRRLIIMGHEPERRWRVRVLSD